MQTRCVNFNESVTAYFNVGIYILHGKLNMFWNLNLAKMKEEKFKAEQKSDHPNSCKHFQRTGD